jgi:hypothetical protein
MCEHLDFPRQIVGYHSADSENLIRSKPSTGDNVELGFFASPKIASCDPRPFWYKTTHFADSGLIVTMTL